MSTARFESLRRVLVAFDLGPGAERALDYAAGVAHCRGARLIALHAIGFNGSPLDLDAPEPDPVADERAAETLFTNWSQRHPETPAEFVTVRSRAPDGILEVARQRDVDLIVVAPLIRPGLEAVAHHSVTTALLRTSPCPVLAVPVRA